MTTTRLQIQIGDPGEYVSAVVSNLLIKCPSFEVPPINEIVIVPKSSFESLEENVEGLKRFGYAFDMLTGFYGEQRKAKRAEFDLAVDDAHRAITNCSYKGMQGSTLGPSWPNRTSPSRSTSIARYE
ncbi:hypothetical protein BGZ65_010800 [Modicella reniformis]|uniref:Uncharacterized protein n=1 Tax=Modicella reniformis TaxID=1440133 RepID=A0A9P6MAP6_9FUNG|nr:hypothetical protein BGZ65_010800 [Modicella reniformis]